MFFSESNPIPNKSDRLELLDNAINFLSEYREKFKDLSSYDTLWSSGVHCMLFNGLKFHTNGDKYKLENQDSTTSLADITNSLK